MNVQPVSSSSISALGYESESMTLEVHFNNGSAYQYFDVPSNIYEEFSESPSKGQFLNEKIRNTYRYMRL